MVIECQGTLSSARAQADILLVILPSWCCRGTEFTAPRYVSGILMVVFQETTDMEKIPKTI